jgi:nitroreductase
MEGFDKNQFDGILGLKAKGLRSVVICPVGYRAEDDGDAKKTKVRFAKEDLVSVI